MDLKIHPRLEKERDSLSYEDKFCIYLEMFY